MTRNNTITRRTALAGAAALPVLPAAAMAGGAESDPAVTLYHEWAAAFREREAAFRLRDEEPERPETMVLSDRENKLAQRLAKTVPTTPEGLVCMVKFAFGRVGDLRSGGEITNPADFMLDHQSDGSDRNAMFSILAYAEAAAA